MKLYMKCLCKFLEVRMARYRMSQVETQYVILAVYHYKSCTFIFILLLITHYVTEPIMVHGQTYHIIT
jgi:hypothetical protein